MEIWGQFENIARIVRGFSLTKSEPKG